MTSTTTLAQRLLPALAGLLIAAGCAGQPDDTAIGDSAASALPGDPAPHHAQRLPANGAPTVPHPVTVATRWEHAPCDLLRDRDLAQVEFDSYRTTPSSNDGGPGCTYDQMSIIEARTTIFTQIPNGLTGLYGERTKFALFDPVDPLNGHPAVIADLKDQRDKGRCAVFVGLSDRQAYRTIVEADPATRQGKSPCKFASDLTVLALHNLHNVQP